MINYKEFNSSLINEVKTLYSSEGWNAYLNDDEKLKRAFDNSSYVLGAFDNDLLVGLIRVVGDSEHIVLIQDLIVDKKYRRQKIGTTLINLILDKYKNVRMIHVNTDKRDIADNKFYLSLGFKPIEKGEMISYFR